MRMRNGLHDKGMRLQRSRGGASRVLFQENARSYLAVCIRFDEGEGCPICSIERKLETAVQRRLSRVAGIRCQGPTAAAVWPGDGSGT